MCVGSDRAGTGLHFSLGDGWYWPGECWQEEEPLAAGEEGILPRPPNLIGQRLDIGSADASSGYLRGWRDGD